MLLISIYTKRIKYHGFRGQVRLELSSDNAAVTVRPANLPPNAAVVRSILLNLSLVDISHLFTKVPIHFLLGVHSFDLNQGRVWVLVRLRPFVTQNRSSHIEPAPNNQNQKIQKIKTLNESRN